MLVVKYFHEIIFSKLLILFRYFPLFNSVKNDRYLCHDSLLLSHMPLNIVYSGLSLFDHFDDGKLLQFTKFQLAEILSRTLLQRDCQNQRKFQILNGHQHQRKFLNLTRYQRHRKFQNLTRYQRHRKFQNLTRYQLHRKFQNLTRYQRHRKFLNLR